jgi:glycosyltransferase involved in cell wall biosynthesis
MKEKKLFYIFILLLPIIDLITSICTRFFNMPISIGMIIKCLFIILLFYYLLFKSKSRYRKTTILYFIFIFIFLFLYFIFKPDLLNKLYLLNEIKYIAKFLFFPISFFTLLCFFDDNKFDQDRLNKVLLTNEIVYCLLLIIPLITNTGFNTYNNGLYGIIGWFYAANEISTILVLLFPFLYQLINNKHKWLFLLIFPLLYVISYIGTKVTLFGLIIVGLICLIFCFLYNKKLFKNPTISSLIIFIVIIFLSTNSYAFNNMFFVLQKPAITEEVIPCPECEDKPGDTLLIKIQKYGLRMLSNRQFYLKNTQAIANESNNLKTNLFGIGFANTNRVNNINITKLSEMDFFDIYYHLGLIGLLIVLYPFIYCLNKLLKTKNKKNNTYFYALMVFLILGISFFAGHVLLAPAVSIYLSLYLLFMLNELDVFKRNINNNKVSILALHMGYGGVESSIASQANMLCNDYDVEIISLYKKENHIPYVINNKVKITYLLNYSSNKEEFKSALKRKNILLVIKEGFKAVKIIILKRKLIKEFIINCNSKYIISSRFSFTKILNRYGNNNIIKIGEEHTYNVNDNYIKQYSKLSNINYLEVVSKTIFNYYSKTLSNVIYIPNTIRYYPKENELSKLNNKNLISVGRLEKEKGFEDLIDVFNIVYKKDKKYILNIFGDGSLKDTLQTKINDLKLNKNIILWGNKDYDFLKKYYQKSSLYIMTSLEESFGIVLIEAMSYGLPCIAFDSAEGAKELIKDNSGLLIPNRDKNQMAQEIIDFYDNYNKKDIIVDTRLIASEYQESIIKQKWLSLLKEKNEKN